MARVPALLRSHPVLAFVAVGLAGAGLLLVVLAAWPLPGLVRRAAEERLQARVTVPVRIERVNLNLFTGRARVSNILVGAVGGGPPILTLPALDLQHRIVVGARRGAQAGLPGTASSTVTTSPAPEAFAYPRATLRMPRGPTPRPWRPACPRGTGPGASPAPGVPTSGWRVRAPARRRRRG